MNPLYEVLLNLLPGKILFVPRLRNNLVLYDQVRKVLELNKKERHIRGGMATKEKYRQKHESS